MYGLGRNIQRLQHIHAEVPDLNIVVATGVYAFLELRGFLGYRSDDQLIELFIRDKDVESGEEAWETWQLRSPVDFLEGYSVLLSVKLVELRKLTVPAAKVAEAFADAVPGSSYSPKLLDEASRLLKSSDPTKSAELHETLKKRYPEDPLSQ